MHWIVLLAFLSSKFIPFSCASECPSCYGVPCQQVKGLFTKSPLPLGYNVITTIPARACNITILELTNSNNFLALRSQKKYIINGNWDVVPSGRYMGAGTGFTYSHPLSSLDSLGSSEAGSTQALPHSGHGEKIESPGPLTQQLEVMIIYEDVNHGISYEYWHPLLSYESMDRSTARQSPPDLNKTTSRVLLPLRSTPETQISGSARNSLMSQQLTITNFNGVRDIKRPQNVGNNVRLGKPKNARRKFQRVLNSDSVSVEPGFSLYSSFQNHQDINRRNNPDFNTERNIDVGRPGFSSYSNYGQDPISRQMFAYNATEFMYPAWKVWQFTPCSKSCGGGQQQAVYICTSIGGHVVSEGMCGGDTTRPVPQTMQCNEKPCPPQWELSEWSPCSATCGAGLQTRTWACVQQMSSSLTRAVPPTACPVPSNSHVPLTKSCSIGDCTRWKVHTWSECSVDCGTGVRRREVLCMMESNAIVTVLPDAACNELEKPPHQGLCHASSCSHNTWFFTEWSSQCIGGCEKGRQYRKVWCSQQAGGPGSCPTESKPSDTRPCSTEVSCAAIWFTGPWTECSTECGGGNRTREVVCVVFLRGSFRATLEVECDQKTRPTRREPCNSSSCPPHWYFTEWTACSRSCDRGSQQRSVQCLDSDQRPSLQCSLGLRPPHTRVCNVATCRTTAATSRGHHPLDPGRGRGLAAQTSHSQGCIDRFRNCRLVQQARLCRYAYYASVCCASCHV